LPRIDLLSPTPEDPETAAMFAEVRARGIEIPNLYRVLGHAPGMLRAWLDFAWPLRLRAQTPRALRELLILRGAQRSQVEYEWVHHVPMALAAGVSQAKVDALATWHDSPLFDDAERAVLRLADEVTDGPGASAACVDELKRHFNESELVELVLTASFYVCVGRVLRSMDVDLEDSFQPGRATP
jgi:alkylhydroperoxidase family enzyme